MSAATPIAVDPAALPTGFRRTLITFTTLVVSIMGTIDATIVAVCMPQMQGSLDATPVTIVWVMTMFNIGQAIGIAVTGKLALRLGRRRVMVGAIVGFVILSCICGLAGSFDAMVVARFFQGLFAAPLIPLSQACIVDAYPPKDRAKGLSVWAMGVILGPAIGPAIGGLLTQHIDWRMCFFVNVPIGAFALLLTLIFIRPTKRTRTRIDWTGLVLAASMVVPFQIALDQGDTLDWFGSKIIVALLGVAVLAAVAFVMRGLTVPGNILPLRLFADRNFALSTISISALGMILFAQSALYPVMLEDLLGWQVDTAGLVMGTSGIGGFFGALIAPKLVARIGSRLTMVLGATIIMIGQGMGLGLDLDMGPWQAPIPGTLAVFGLMIAYVPTAGLAFSSVGDMDRDDAAAEYNFVKTIAMSIGVSLVSTLLYRRPQYHWNVLAGHVRPDNQAIDGYSQALGTDGWSPLTATVIAEQVKNQATMLAVIDVFFVMIGIAGLVIVVAALMRSTRGQVVAAADPG